MSGPITQHPEGPYIAMRDGIMIGNDLFDLGYAPIVPHLTVIWEQEYGEDRQYEDWMELDLALIPACAAVYRMPGFSPGGDREVEHAKRLGIPVFEDLTDLALSIPTQSAQLDERVQSAPVACDKAVIVDPDDGLPGPIKAAISRIRGTFQRKNSDYADEARTWDSNFRDVSEQMGWHGPAESCEALIAVKQARLRSMRANGRLPQNESVMDTKLDRAVYSTISLAIALEEEEG